MTREEVARVQLYLRQKFGTPGLRLKPRPPQDGSAEVWIDDEFVGVVFRDDEDGDLSYAFHMSILEMDLPESPGG